VQLYYNHVGNCHVDATEDDCPGTFAHPLRSGCSNRGLDLTHEMVEVRPPGSVEEAAEE
jgi:hypothetical protein